MDSTGVNRPTLHTRGASSEGVGTGVSKYEREMGMGRVESVEGKAVQGAGASEGKLPEEGEGEGEGEAQERREEAEMFMRIERPRVRYDVEVITKLFVYSGEYYLVSLTMEFC